jgi:hypothetical protein
MVVNAANAVPVELTACTLFGHAQVIIRGISGKINLMATGFHNTYDPGWDIYIDRPKITSPLSVVVLGCESQSTRFLGTYTRTPQEPSLDYAVASTTVVGLRHHNVNAGYFDRERLAAGDASAVDLHPSIFWDAAGFGSSLQLIGCHLSSDVVIGYSASCVVDVGTVFVPQRGGNGSAMAPWIPGGTFKGNMAVLRGTTGLPAAMQGTEWKQLKEPAVRMGENYMVMAPELVTDYPWKAGDVWLGSPRSDLVAEAPVRLRGALHHTRANRSMTTGVRRPSPAVEIYHESAASSGILHREWEPVFGSEDYSGPWYAVWHPGRSELTLDGLVVPELGIYEVLWSIDQGSGRREGDEPVRAMGRDTLIIHTKIGYHATDYRWTISVVASNNPGSEQWGASFPPWTPPAPVSLSGWFCNAYGEDATQSLYDPVDQFRFMRLRLAFSNIQNPPWRSNQHLYEVVIRRLSLKSPLAA